MPISIELTPGLLTPEGERSVHPRITELLLRVHGLTGNAFITGNVSGHVRVYPEADSFVGGKSQSLAVVAVTAPPITFPNQEVKAAFVKGATDIIDELKAGSHPRERTFVNVTHCAGRHLGAALALPTRTKRWSPRFRAAAN